MMHNNKVIIRPIIITIYKLHVAFIRSFNNFSTSITNPLF